MATNSISSFVQQKYTKITQALLQERLLAMEVANTSLIASMPNGNTLNFPRPSYSPVAQYVKYTNVTDTAVIATNETLVINDQPTVSFTWDYIDQEDAAYEAVGIQTKNIAFRLQKYVDGKVFHEIYASAGNTVDNAGSAWVFTGATPANPIEVAGAAWATLANNDVDTTNLVTISDPFFVNYTSVKAASSRFTLGDAEFEKGKIRATRGYAGSFLNTDMYWTPNLTTIGTFAAATTPAANDTVTVNGVTFKYVSTIGATANNVLIESADPTATMTNLMNAINQASYDSTAKAAADLVAGTKFVACAAADAVKLNGFLATQATTTLTIKSIYGQRVFSRSMTTATNKFGQFVTYLGMMERGSIDLALRDNVHMEQEKVQSQYATRYQFLTRFGVKTFAQGAERMVKIPVETRAAE